MRKYRICSAVSAFVIAAEMFSGAMPVYAAEKLSNEEFYKQICGMIEEDDADYNPEEAVTEAQITPNENHVVINGVKKTLTEVNALGEDIDNEDLQPKNISGRVLIPTRVMANALGCDIDWDNDTKTVTFAKNDVEFSVDCNQYEGDYDGNPDCGVLTNKGKAFVPVRAMERLGCSLTWDGSATIRLYDDVVLESRRLLVGGNNLDSDSEVKAAIRMYGEPKKCIVQNDGSYMVVSYSNSVTTGEIREILSELKGCAAVTYAEPDILCEFSMSSQGNSSASEITEDYSGIRKFIRENRNSLSGNVTVAVIDSGIDKNHSIFQGRLGTIGTDVADGNGHGTHVAGIIASLTSEIGDKVKIKPYKIPIINNTGGFDYLYSSNNQTFASVFNAAIAGAAECDVVNISLSGSSDNCSFDYTPFEKGNPFVVVAAGNNSGNMDHLNKIATDILKNDKIDAVAATAVDTDRNIMDFSNFSDSYRNDLLAAVGKDVASAKMNGGKITFSGTSQAAPQIAAAAAVIMLSDGKSSANAKDKLLTQYRKDFNGNNMGKYGVGILSMSEAVILPQSYYRWSQESLTMKPGEEKQVKLYFGENGTETEATQKVEVYSSDSDIASVTSDGKIMAIKPGTAKIKYKQNGEEGNTEVKVTVSEKETNNNVVSYEVSETEVKMKVGDRKNIKVYANMSDGNREDVTTSSELSVEDESVVNISSDGTVKAVGEGTTYITLVHGGTASHNENSKKRVKVVVEKAEFSVVDYEWSETDVGLTLGESKNVKLYAKMSDGSRKDVTASSEFFSNDDSVAEISSSGKITAVGEGTTYITVAHGGTASHNNNQRIKVVVTSARVDIVGYEWSESEINLNSGESANVRLYAKMSDGSRKDVTSDSEFMSNDDSVAEISSSGKITANGEGTTYITVAHGGTASANGVARLKVIVAEESESEFEVSPYGGGVEVVGYNGNERILTVPESINGEQVVRIGKSAFEKNNNISSVSIPSGVTEIGSYAFKSCRNLKSVTIPRSVSIIESYAFDGCSTLSDVSLPRTMNEISAYTFRGCASLGEITIPNSITAIGNSAFANCKTLRIEISENVTEIHKNAFTRGDYVVMRGKQGSVAEEYAEANGFKFDAR